MSFAYILTAYININLLVIAGYLCLMLYPILAGLVKKAIAARSLLKMHYAVLSILFLLILFYPILPESNTFYPSVQIWSAQSQDTFNEGYSPPDSEGFFVFPIIKRTESFDTNNARLAAAGAIICLLLIWIINICRDLRKLFNIRKGSYIIRTHKSVSIYANDHIEMPFSYWLPGMANIIIPTELIAKRADFKITIFHELQHHRNGDTKWVYLVWFLRSICIFNPCIHFWCRLISELQEFACDEVLVDQKKIDSQDYACCLFEAAKSSSDRRRVPACATGLTLMVQRKLLKRRIEKMLNKIPIQIKWHTNLLVMILIMGLMTSISCALKNVVQDRRITMEQAAAMAEKAGRDTDYPIVVNDLVLRELNAYLGTPEGREYIRSSLERMKYFKKGIEEKINGYGVPTEFLAIPLVESGYQRLQKGKPGLGAGLWDFIKPTANKFGLKTNDQVDERLDVDASTDAAMRYLLANERRFEDWQLSVLAYNIGESNVQKSIEKTGSRDVWDVSRAFFKNGNNYYAKFMAAVIIIKNPESVADKSEKQAKHDGIHLIWPMKGWVTSKYGYRISPFSNENEFHNGIDIAASIGEPIHAADSGSVVTVEFSPDVYGHYIILQHKDNFQTLYAQCEKIMAKEGQAVKSGDIISTCGSSGKSTGPHLHFELRKDGDPIDPEKYIKFN